MRSPMNVFVGIILLLVCGFLWIRWQERTGLFFPARDLYTSSLFRKTSAYARQIADEWYILSGKHGLVHPDQVIAPYEKTLKRMPVKERRAWAVLVARQLRRVLRRGDHVVFLAGVDYRRDLLDPIRRTGCTVEIPMEGLSFGQQLRWLKRRVG